MTTSCGFPGKLELMRSVLGGVILVVDASGHLNQWQWIAGIKVQVADRLIVSTSSEKEEIRVTVKRVSCSYGLIYLLPTCGCAKNVVYGQANITNLSYRYDFGLSLFIKIKYCLRPESGE